MIRIINIKNPDIALFLCISNCLDYDVFILLLRNTIYEHNFWSVKSQFWSVKNLNLISESTNFVRRRNKFYSYK